MKLPEVKRLASTHTVEELKAAEAAILDELEPAIEVGGEDEGEQLTHIIGAMDVLAGVSAGETFTNAFRAFAQRVRDSIS